MSEFKGTPGEWRVEADMRIDMDARPFHPQKEFLAGWNIVLDGGEIVGIEGIVPGEHAKADAHIMAASKDLLKELAHLVRLIEPLESAGSLDIPGLATLNGARNAIAKALQS